MDATELQKENARLRIAIRSIQAQLEEVQQQRSAEVDQLAKTIDEKQERSSWGQRTLELRSQNRLFA